MYGFKHNINKVIEACADVLEKKMGFNQAQVIRFFEILPIEEFPNTTKVPLEGRENWYYLRDRIYHNALFFNYETREYKLLDPESKWQRKTIEEFQKSEEQLVKEKHIYIDKMEKIKQSFAYKNLKSIIGWYFSCPDISLRHDILPTPKKFVLMLLEKNSKWLKLNNHQDLKALRDSLLEVYHYEERNKK